MAATPPNPDRMRRCCKFGGQQTGITRKSIAEVRTGKSEGGRDAKALPLSRKTLALCHNLAKALA